MPPRLHSSPLEIRASDLVALRSQAAGIDLARTHRASSVLVGGRRSAFRGRGMDFEESRAYQPGDDVRTIDWRVTARRGEPHTKVFRPERERPVVLLVDVGSSMAFGSRGQLKSVLAGHVAALIAWMSAARGDRVGAFIVSDETHAEIRPTTQAANLLRIFNSLERLQAKPPASGDPRPESQTKDFSAIDLALGRVAQAARPGTLVFLLADFWRMTAQGERHLTACAQSCELVCGFTFDPWERELPGREDFAFSDGRTSLTLHADDRRVRDAYRGRFDNHLSRLETLCRRNAAHLLALSTEEPALAALRRGLSGARASSA